MPAARRRGTGRGAHFGGTVAFLLTDVEGSTRLWQQYPSVMPAVIRRHTGLVRRAVEQHHGAMVKERGEGDSTFCVFARASDALRAAEAAQVAINAERWPVDPPLRVRAAVHVGEVEHADGDYLGTEVARCARLRDLGHGGQTLLSDAVCALVGAALPRDLHLVELGRYVLRGFDAPERVWQLQGPDLPSDFPPLRGRLHRPGNLRPPLTSFVGRRTELAEVARLLAGARLVTLIGVGGGGKSRLALQVAADALRLFPDGAWWVDVDEAARPEQVENIAAVACGLSGEPGSDPGEQLAAHLRSRSALLVLDGCEPVLGACAELARRLLERCPAVTVLATSREPLRVPGEQLFPVPPLSTPEGRGASTADDVTASEAAQLFVDRARLRQPGFAVTDDNAGKVADVCRRLEGLPLSIELAAARIGVLGLDEVAVRVANCFDTLTSRDATAVGRHRSVQEAIRLSYDLLSAAEQSAFGRLSVFRGAFDEEAARAVLGDSSDDGSPSPLEVLVSLAEKSLVVSSATADPTASFSLLEPLRQFGAARLIESGEDRDARGRHARHYAAVAAAARPQLVGRDQAMWLDRLDRERGNTRVAIDWAIDQGDAELALSMCGDLWRFWYTRGHVAEGREHLRRALAVAGSAAPAAALAAALHAAGTLASWDDDLDTAQGYLTQCLALRRTTGDRVGAAAALNNLGLVEYERRDMARARALFEESLALKRDLGDRRGEAVTLANLSLVGMLVGDYVYAARMGEASLAIKRELGDEAGVARSLVGLGAVAYGRNDLDTAAQRYHVALRLMRAIGDAGGEAEVLAYLGSVAHEALDLPQARDLYRASLEAQARIGQQHAAVVASSRLAYLSLQEGDCASALDGLQAVRRAATQPDSLKQESEVSCYLAQVLIALGRLDEAASELRTYLDGARRSASAARCVRALELAAVFAAARSDARLALALDASARADRERSGAPRSPLTVSFVAPAMSRARSQVPATVAAEAEAEGRAMSIDEALRRAEESLP